MNPRLGIPRFLTPSSLASLIPRSLIPRSRLLGSLVPRSLLLGSLVALSLSTTAWAEAPIDDGLYGRLEGDVAVSLGALASFRQNSEAGAGASGRLLYLWSVGPYAVFDANLNRDTLARSTLALGLSLRPLFLARWQYDWERGPAWVDLTFDSLALEVGPIWTWIDGSARAPGIETGISVQFPLTPRATGPWLGLRGALQWTHDQLVPAGHLNSGPAAAFAAALGWSWAVNAHLADAGDRLLR